MVGNFFVDMWRVVVYIHLPVALIIGVIARREHRHARSDGSVRHRRPLTPSNFVFPLHSKAYEFETWRRALEYETHKCSGATI
jgi:hypothetical protein